MTSLIEVDSSPTTYSIETFYFSSDNNKPFWPLSFSTYLKLHFNVSVDVLELWNSNVGSREMLKPGWLRVNQKPDSASEWKF